MEPNVAIQNQALEVPVTHMPGLNSAEIGNLWNSYVLSSMLVCVLEYFMRTTDDPDIRLLTEIAAEMHHMRISKSMDILNKENLPIPNGFSMEDVNLGAPRLFSDIYHLYYMKNMNRHSVTQSSYYHMTSVRPDMCEFYAQGLDMSLKWFEKMRGIALSKGIFVRPPYVCIDKEVDYVKKQNFLTGFFGEKRPLLSQEVAAVFYITKSNYIGKFLLRGFRQAASTKEVRE